jgi:hypothetical protein
MPLLTELGLAELKLNAYALSIQIHVNKATAIKHWADKCLGIIVAKQYNDYIKINAFMKYEVLRSLVIKNDTYAEALAKILDSQDLVISQFQYLSQTVQHVADSFGKLARFRGKNESIG